MNIYKIRKILIPAILTFLIWFIINQGWKIDFSKPIVYWGGDDFLHNMVIKKAVLGKDIWTDEHLGYPFRQQMYGFPLIPFMGVWIGYIVGLFTDNYAIATNIYIISMIVMAAVSFSYVAEKLKITKMNAVLGGIMFAFCQYAAIHGSSHFTALCYWTIPLFVLLCYYVYTGDYSDTKYWKIQVILICYLGASSDPFYAFFACFFLLICALAAVLKGNIKNFCLGIKFILGIVVSMIFNLFPSIANTICYGSLTESVNRTASEAITWGLKLVTLVMPFNGDHILSGLTQKYIKEGLPTGENICNYLGIFGIIGFVLLVISLIEKEWIKQVLGIKEAQFYFIVVMNLFAILLGVSGGIGTAFAVLVTPAVRVYNRISIYIYFFSILSVLFIADRYIIKGGLRLEKKYIVVATVIVIVHLLDMQVYKMVLDYSEMNEQYEEDYELTVKIEESIGREGRVLQLPYLSFPENYTESGKGNYLKSLNGWFHSNSLYWSGGALQGTPADSILRERYSIKNMDEIVLYALQDSYDGIYVDTAAYVNAESIIADLERITGQTPIMNKSGSVYFFNIQSLKRDEIHTSKVYLYTGTGFFEKEQHESEGYWQWSQQESKLYLYNNSEDTIAGRLIFDANTLASGGYTLSINTGQEMVHIQISDENSQYVVPITVFPGNNEIVFTTDASLITPSQDSRALSFRIRNYYYEED